MKISILWPMWIRGVGATPKSLLCGTSEVLDLIFFSQDAYTCSIIGLS